MAVRNCRDIGENLKLIMDRLVHNPTLVKLLYYTDTDPLSQQDLTNDQLKSEIFNKLIRIIPKVGTKETAQSIIAITVLNGTRNFENNEFKDITIRIETFIPLTQWFMMSTNLRPFAILGEIQASLNNKTINGLGRMTGGDFNLEFLTDEIACYEQTFSLTTYD